MGTATLTSCASTGSQAVTPAPASSAKLGSQAKGTLTLHIDPPSRNAAHRRRPSYLSAATTQLMIDIQQNGSSISGYPQTVSLTPTSAGCTSTIATTSCQLEISLEPGSYTLTLTTLDANNTPLSAAQDVPVTVQPGTDTNVSITLDGIPVALTLSTTSTSDITPTEIFQLCCGTTPLIASALDADDNIIIGPGAPVFTATVDGATPGSGLAVANPLSTQPNVLMLTSTGFGTARLHVTASSGAGSSISSFYPVRAAPYEEAIAGHVDFYNPCSLTDGNGSASRFCNPAAATYDSADGAIYVLDTCSLRRVTLGGAASSITKQTVCGFADGPPDVAKLQSNASIAYDSQDGNFYVADQSNCAIRRVTPDGTVSTIAGDGSQSCGFADGSGPDAAFNYPNGIAFDSDDGNLYVTEARNCAVRQVTTSGSVETIFGGPSQCSQPSSVYPTAIAYDSADGNLYLADNCLMRRLTTSGQITTVAGQPPNPSQSQSGCGFVDGTSSINELGPYTRGIAYDFDDKNLYFSDSNSCAMRQLSAAGVVTTIVGTPPVESCGFRAGLSGGLDLPYPVVYVPQGESLFTATPGDGLLELVEL